MNISATVQSRSNSLTTRLRTSDNEKTLNLPVKPNGLGSAVNGGELLLLALATCFCNDIYREAAKRKIAVHEVEVVATATFGAEAEPGRDFKYAVSVKADATDDEIKDLIEYTDQVAEIHNTLRKGVRVDITKS